MVLDEAPVGEDREQTVVADEFRLLRHVAVLPRLLLPGSPADIVDRLLRNRQTPVDVREGDRTRFLARRPLDGVPHHLAVGLLRRVRLVVGVAPLAPVHRGAAREPRDRAVARRVAEERRLHADFLACARVAVQDGGDASVRVLLDAVHVLVQHRARRQTVRVERHLLPLVLVELRGQGRVVAVDRHDLAQDVSERGVRSHVDRAAGRDANFRRVAAAQHRTVLQEERFHLVTRSRLRHADARDAAADNNQIPCLTRVPETKQPQLLLPCAQRRKFVRRLFRFRREPERVAAPVEARQVVEADLNRLSGDKFHVPRQLPVPVFPMRAQFRRKRRTVYDHLETSRRAFRPDRVPVPRPRPHGVPAGRGERRRRHGIAHGLSIAVRHHVAGADLPHGMWIDHPSAEVAETLALHESRRGRCGTGHVNHHECPEQYSCFHTIRDSEN